MVNHDQKRLEANRKLVSILAKEIEKSPSQRFGQILRNCGFVEEAGVDCWNDLKGRPTYWNNEFNFEPWVLLARVWEKTRVD